MNDFADALGPVLTQRLDGFERLVSAERLSGGASQETYRVVAVIDGEERLLALRRSAGGELKEDDDGRPGLAIEAKLMQVAKAAGVPEPEVYLVLDPADGIGEGFLMEWLDGHTLGARIVRSPDLDEIRPRLAHQCGEVLARIHGIDPETTGLAPHLQTVPTDQFVNDMWSQYQELGSPHPMIDFTAQWLLANLPADVDHRLVHNDFRNGNIMVTPEGVTAVLDWEVCHLGDPMRDLGWICTNSWRFGKRELPVGGFGHYDDLFAGYESVTGEPVNRDHVHFWEVFGSFWWAIGCLKMAEHWRSGPDPSVERPAIGRRSSECQVDCVNLLIPGPVELVEGATAVSSTAVSSTAVSSTDMPSVVELVTSVRDFLHQDVMAVTEGRPNFMARVAGNSLDTVLRELDLGPPHLAGELDRLRRLLGRSDGDTMTLRWELVERLRAGSIDLDDADLQQHLRTTVVNQVAIDQPTYSGFAAAIEND